MMPTTTTIPASAMATLIAAVPLAQAALVLALSTPVSAEGTNNPFQTYWNFFSGRAQNAAQAVRERGPLPPYPGQEFPLGQIGKTKLIFRPELFKLEALSAVIALVFVLAYLNGRTANKRSVRKWIQNASPILANEFAYIGATTAAGASTDRLIWNGSDEALLYASGRRGLKAMEVLFEFFPRHDLIQTVFWPLWDLAFGSATQSKRDLVTVRFVLPPSANPLGVFALVNKSDLRATQAGRYDLTFAQLRMNAVEQRGLDENWILMSEAADTTDAILGPVVGQGKPRRDGILPGLQSLLSLPEVRDSLLSVSVTDLPFLKPEEPIEDEPRYVVLSLSPGRSLEKATAAIFTLAFNIVDAIDQGLWTPPTNTVAKLKKARADANAALLKEFRAEQEAAEEEAREAARRKAAKAKLEKLSPAEQEKKKELEKKRQARKGGKMKLR